MPRALWKGNISFGLVNIPVGLFPAESRDEGLSFVQLDRRSLSPIGYKRYNKATGEEVPWDEIVKGYEYEPGRYVVLSDEDFERANVKATHTVEIMDFVNEEDIDEVYFDKPYFLAPDSATSKGYALLRETLRRTGKIGIARVVIRTREHLGAVIARGPMLLLEILRYPFELRSADDLDVPGEDLNELGVTDKELKMAELLVQQMVEDWTPEKYKDSFRDDLLARIKEKIAAGQIEGAAASGEAEEVGTGAEVVDIMDLLKRSVERAGKAKPEPSKPAADEAETADKGAAKKSASRGRRKTA